MTLLRFTDDTGTTQELIVTEAEIDREFDKQDAARVFLRRDRISEDNISRGDTEMYVVDDSSQTNDNARFGGLFRDIDRQGGVTEVMIDSFERLGRYATPTSGGERFENVDDVTVIEDAVNNVPDISQGTIEDVASNPVSFLFSHTSQAKKIREVADSTSGEVRYNPDKTVDYLTRRGTDRRNSVTLSPSNQNIKGDFKAEKKGGEEEVTHLRVLGTGEGRHQRELNFVPADDTASYDNKRTYTNNDWSSGDLKKWKVVSNKDITDLDALEEFGRNLIDDINSAPYIDVKTTIDGVESSLGDTFQVQQPEEEIDRAMRIVTMTERILPTGTEYDVTLSSRRVSRMDESGKDREDIQRYNKALEGTAVPINAGGGRQPVNADNNYEFQFYYPGEVKFEHRLNVRVSGLAYRAYSSGAAAGGDHTHDVVVSHPSHSHTIESSEFQHSHSLSTTDAEAEFHSHNDGDLEGGLHDHPDGTLDASSHRHGSFSLDANSHGHFNGTLDADSHGHTAGSYDATSHGHNVDVTASSDPYFDRGVVAASGSALITLGDTGGSFEDVIDITGLPTGFDAYEMGYVHVNVTSAEAVVEVRLQEFASTNYFPSDRGAVLCGTSDPDGQTNTVTLVVPENVGDQVDVQARTSRDANTNIQASWMFISEHQHDVPINVNSADVGPAVFGTSDDENANVSGETDDENADVDGETSDENADVTGSTDDEGNAVAGDTGGDAPGVSGDTDNQGGIRTSTTALGTTETESTEPNQGAHSHDPEPGIIETFGTDVFYPQNCDVLVNGQSQNTSFGDGTGPFDDVVSIEGALNEGQINTIEVTSDTLGHIQAFVEGDVYRQIRGEG